MPNRSVKIISSGLLIIFYLLIAFSSSNDTQLDLSRVETASVSQKNKISGTLNEGYSIDELFVVKSNDFKNIFFAGAIINEQIAIWSIGGEKDSPNLVFSINDYAFTVSGMGLGKELKDPITENEDGVNVLIKYLENINE
jgi:hypothetical protein